MSKSADANLQIYDLSGRQVRALALGMRAAGTHEVRIEASGLASGTYLYRLVTDQQALSRKMSVIR